MSEFHEAAKYYAARGMPVLPLQPRGKIPANSNGATGATTDGAVIDNWWRGVSDLNVGLATGAGAGVFVLDIDDEAGENALAELERNNTPCPSPSRRLHPRNLATVPDRRHRPHLPARRKGGYLFDP